jgi:hypothetical protein
VGGLSANMCLDRSDGPAARLGFLGRFDLPRRTTRQLLAPHRR